MRRLLLVRAAALAAVLLAGVGCSDDDTGAAPTTTRPAIATAADPALDRVLLQQSDLPAGFAPSGNVDDTITEFCIGQDATAGLQASARSLVGFGRQGAAVIHIAFRFRPGDATAFVQQAGELLDGCNEVPGTDGVAFTYSAAAPELESALAGTDEHVTGYGVSVGSGSRSIDIGVFRYGEVGQLVAVFAVDTPRGELDELAATAFTAASARQP